jgi:hypothetical protein
MFYVPIDSVQEKLTGTRHGTERKLKLNLGRFENTFSEQIDQAC